ncbi:MAG: hypothetical protein E6I87_12565 [Chloroflexi bacterium]|nr:MAG: hypothetical protein E6I87_12565 [Chloroflexota bacterium]
MLIFALGLCVGVVLGTIIVGFLAVSAYDRGFDDALERRGDRIAELRARHIAVARRLRDRARAS